MYPKSREEKLLDALKNKISSGGGGGDSGGSIELASWSEGTDDQIATMIDAAHAGQIDLQEDGGWAVGDVRTISISAFTGGGNVSHAAQDIDIVISSFDEYMGCGNVMQFDFKDTLTSGNRMNGSNTVTGGYGSLEISTVTIPALSDALPGWLKSRLVEFPVLAYNGSGVVNIAGNRLALRSVAEIAGSNSWAFEGEGSQIGYYTITSNRIKFTHNGGRITWWTRSLRSTGEYCFLSEYGSISAAYATNTRGIAPFGCL